MRTIIAGGRGYIITPEDEAWLDTLNITEVVSGRATGADAGGEAYAAKRGLPVSAFPALWGTFGKRAGAERNRRMAEYAEAVALFPGGKGTADMYAQARSHRLTIHVREGATFDGQEPSLF